MSPLPRPATEGHDRQILPYIQEIPLYTPRQISRQIREQGYIGQNLAVRASSLMAFRHINRLKKMYLQKKSGKLLPRKNNLLFVGPTGCGKTFLVEILFRDILKLPTVIVDMSTYSETGYVGQDAGSILTRLLYAADLNLAVASIGVICLDEFDKLASGQNNAVFAGAGTTKDVSGLGVQRELLKMLESSEITVPVELSHSDYAPKTILSTENIPFIACGAFSGLKGLIERSSEHIGFGRDALSGGQDRIAVSYTVDDVELSRNFQTFGFLPELIARFTRIIPFGALGEKELTHILRKRILERYKNEFSLEGIDLMVREEVLVRVIEESLAKETGARGIEATLVRYLEDAAYEAYSTEGCSRLHLLVSNGKVEYRIE